jgi:prolyl oligopeptidase
VLVFALAIGGIGRTASSAVPMPAPTASVNPVTDVYFGRSVVDPYRWMEKLDDPVVQNWMKSQSDYTTAVLSSIPARATIGQRIASIRESYLTSSPYPVQIAGRNLFYELFAPHEEAASLFVRDSLGNSHLVFDPTRSEGTGYEIGLFAPSNSGRYVALDTSAGGTESGTLAVIDSATGRPVDAAIDRVHTNWNVPSWLPGDKSFLYTRFPKLATAAATAASQQGGQVFLHRLGTSPASDALVFGQSVVPSITPADVSFALAAPDSDTIVGIVCHGTSNVADFFITSLAGLRGTHTRWRPLGQAHLSDHISDPGTFGFLDVALHAGFGYFIRYDAAKRTELVEVPLSGDMKIDRARVIVPAGDFIIDNIAAASDGLYLNSSRAGVSQLDRLDYRSRAMESIALPESGSMDILSASASEPGVTFNFSTWAKEDYQVVYTPAFGHAKRFAVLKDEKTIDSTDLRSEEVFATSSDGTHVPLSIIHKAGVALDGSHPALLYGYGSYGTSITPYFRPTLLPWYERGGIYAIAHVRGGGEYGEPWHRAGQGPNRQHSIDDFIACARYLIDKKYTVPSKLGIEGVSAGGVLVGNALVQQPGLFAFVIAQQGISDLLGHERTANGPGQAPEVGSSRTLAGFENLYKMSPYQHVVDGTAYPAVLLTTGSNDPRVSPWIVTKMAARLQAATSSGKPVLLRVSYGAGHSGASTLSQDDDLSTDIYTFALWQAGDPDFQPAAVVPSPVPSSTASGA